MKTSNTHGADYVEFCEFRLFLVYLVKYFELWVEFSIVDTGDDRRVDLDEFKNAVPYLEKLGVKIENPDEEFKLIDTNGGGQILFQEFCDYALKKNLSFEDVEDDS
mmetsp:Transcript_34548/g.54038  ORF Transcript_34548/g.54038 Transcript_34548/m.54038 type:complete len:106 (-) Transcript_34548:11-328(-)